MILELSLGEHVRVLIDDEQPERMTPEQTEDYLTRMRRTALAAYTDIPDEEPVTTALDDEAGS